MLCFLSVSSPSFILIFVFAAFISPLPLPIHTLGMPESLVVTSTYTSRQPITVSTSIQIRGQVSSSCCCNCI
ncbi:hypothetical protein F4604DRAFT_742230 [Suillus subluteus]|nr:hypothetical protein F4604DRAFT_742230 [Suillus subluteus]